MPHGHQRRAPEQRQVRDPRIGGADRALARWGKGRERFPYGNQHEPQGRSTWALLACLGLACACSSDGQQGPSTGDNSTAYRGPGFKGAGASGSGQSIGAGLDSVGCGDTHPLLFSGAPSEDEQVEILCFFGDDPDAPPAASIEWVVETAENDELVHVRLTLDPEFVDNSYGQTAIGWQDRKKGRKLKDLVGSDHAEMVLTDGRGNTVLHFKVDYISEDEDAPSGYASLGVSGGDGKLMEGDEDDVVQVSTSLDRNFNACGLDEFDEDSPATDADYSTSPEAPNWDYRVVYDVWIRRSAFGAAGFGQALIDHVHASPSKADDNTIEVTPGECPPVWEYCTDPDGCHPDGPPPATPLEPCEMLDAMCGNGEPPPPPAQPVDCDEDPEGCPSPM